MGDENKYHSGARRAGPSEVKKKRLPVLTTEQQARAQEAKEIVHQHCPEIVPMLQGLVALGMIDGWRSVTIIRKPDHGNF